MRFLRKRHAICSHKENNFPNLLTVLCKDSYKPSANVIDHNHALLLNSQCVIDNNRWSTGVISWFLGVLESPARHFVTLFLKRRHKLEEA
jgi:hypothetical protein